MSAAPPPDNGLAGLTSDEALAMDYALGGLGRADRKAADLRLVGDPAFRELVERWQALLAPLDDATAPQTPPAAIWAAIAAETTAPATALLVRQAVALGLSNLTLLLAHVRVVPARGN